MLTIIFTSLLFIETTYTYPIGRAKDYRQTYSETLDILPPRSLCSFPSDELLAFVDSPDHSGWLLNPEYPCTPEFYCSYFCKSGYIAEPSFVSSSDYHSWNPSNGKVLCNRFGNVENHHKQLCIPGNSNIYLVNLFGSQASFCQRASSTVNSLASNFVDAKSFASIVAYTSFYGSTSSLFYLNPPGTDVNSGCSLGSSQNNRGIWSPYILDVSVDHAEDTVLKLGWNPHYLNDAYWGRIPSNWGVIVECVGVGCNNADCYIDPKKHGINECENALRGYGSSSNCIVKIPKRAKGIVTLFSSDNIGEKKRLFSQLSILETTQSPDSEKQLEDQVEESLYDKERIDEQQKEIINEGFNDNEEISLEKEIKNLEKEGLDADLLDSKVDKDKKQGIPYEGPDSKRSKHTSLLYLEFSGDSCEGDSANPKTSYITMSGDKDSIKFNEASFGEFNTHDLDQGDRKSYINKMNEMCRYLVTQIGIYSSKLCSYLRQKHDGTLTSNYEVVDTGLGSIGEVATERNQDKTQENSALSTLKGNVYWLSIIMTGLVTFFQCSFEI